MKYPVDLFLSGQCDSELLMSRANRVVHGGTKISDLRCMHVHILIHITTKMEKVSDMQETLKKR